MPSDDNDVPQRNTLRAEWRRRQRSVQILRKQAIETRKRIDQLEHRLGTADPGQAATDQPPELDVELDAARGELRRIHEQRVAAVQQLEATRSALEETRARHHDDEMDRWNRRVADAGLADYFSSGDDLDWLPGYARNPQFLEHRRTFVDQCCEKGGLLPSDRVLDIGCGIGGVAVHLIDVLTSGSYLGVDVERRAIASCRARISSRHPEFRFEAMDVWSGKYNPDGRSEPGDYRFPHADGAFDFALLRSVFTHMLPPDIDHYLSELHRLLSTDGRCVATFFLLDRAARDGVAAGATFRRFAHDYDGYRLDDEDVAEAAVAIDEEWVTDVYATNGFEVTGIDRGEWRRGTPGQDTVYAVRR